MIGPAAFEIVLKRIEKLSCLVVLKLCFDDLPEGLFWWEDLGKEAERLGPWAPFPSDSAVPLLFYFLSCQVRVPSSVLSSVLSSFPPFLWLNT